MSSDSRFQGIAGVYWTILMHSVLLIANCFSIHKSWIELQKKRTSRFWISSLVASAMLLLPSIQGIVIGIQLSTRAFMLRLTFDLIGNLSARLGMLIVTILRLYRLKIISKESNRKRTFIVQSLVVAVVLSIACISNIWWVAAEEAYWPVTNGIYANSPPSLVMIQQVEGYVGLFSLLFVTAFNIVADYWFVRTIIGVRRSAMGDDAVQHGTLVYVKTYLTFLPTVIHFTLCFILYSIFVMGLPAPYASYVASSHLMAVPATILFTFIWSTIPATKSLVAHGSKQSGSGSKTRQSLSATGREQTQSLGRNGSVSKSGMTPSQTSATDGK
ncbi:hypothetical protein BCR44DRAFT_73387 [Catenaria anguillulae PL171]|uniref:G protein-coupled receptor n=1 Tax=Catenaria anguillulae PL171 TaxID=765915 RepID=A0A1Y2HP51_9FUNG|nr:hypothetical protein BCR44DRAFT_73387 [Catenaria anguillulae PL171]